MRASVITALGLAASALAGPIQFVARDGECGCEPETVVVTVPAPIETAPPTEAPTVEPSTPTTTPAVVVPEAPAPPKETPVVPESPAPPKETPVLPTAPSTPSIPGVPTTPSTPAPTTTPDDCDEDRCHGTGPILQDLAPQTNRLLTVTGTDGQDLLISLNQEIYDLLEGNVSIGDSIGEIIGDAASAGTLLADLAPIIDCIITIVGDDSRILLLRLAPELADLVNGALSDDAPTGTDALARPIGAVVGSLGLTTKRAELPDTVSHLVRVVGEDARTLLVDVVGDLGDVLHNLHLSGIVGQVVDTAASIPALLARLGPDVEGLMVAIAENGSALLIRLSPPVADLVGDVLPNLETPVGNVVGVASTSL